MNDSWLFTRRNRGRQGPLTACLTLVAIILCAQPFAVQAAEGVRTVALGESNSEAQRAEVMAFLNASETDQVVTVTVAETFQAMDGVFELAGVDSAYSSTALTCQSAGSGIDVMTRNIEVIPPELYALALLTAGLSDVELAVAAPNDAPALGMTAMTGVFKTWDMAACSGSGNDPARRQLALEELALIAEIGQDLEAVRQTTLVVLDAQQKIVAQPVTKDELAAIVAAETDEVGLDLSDADEAAIVDFLARLGGANIDWGLFANGWSTQHAEDGSGVVLTATTASANPAGVGGATGPIRIGPALSTPDVPTVTPSPTATPKLVLPPPAATPPAARPTPVVMGTVSDGDDSGWLRLWPLAALVLVGAPLGGFLLHRRANAAPAPSLMDRRQIAARESAARRAGRRPVATEPIGRIRRVRFSREEMRN